MIYIISERERARRGNEFLRGQVSKKSVASAVIGSDSMAEVVGLFDSIDIVLLLFYRCFSWVVLPSIDQTGLQ